MFKISTQNIFTRFSKFNFEEKFNKNINYGINKIFHTKHYFLYQACLFEDLDLVEKLLKSGADPNYFLEERNALYIAIIKKNKKLLKLLLKSGANPNVFFPIKIDRSFNKKENIKKEEYKFQSLLGLACNSGMPSLVKVLLKHGVDFNFYFNHADDSNDTLLLRLPIDWLKEANRGSKKHLKLIELIFLSGFDFEHYKKFLLDYLIKKQFVFCCEEILILSELYSDIINMVKSLVEVKQLNDFKNKLNDETLSTIGKAEKNVKIL